PPETPAGPRLPGILEPRKRREQALVSGTPGAEIPGVRTRKLTQWGQALGWEGVSRSTVWQEALDFDLHHARRL
ncbi:MAG: hypothetical protein OWV35_04035, partial [Firmicutes bacterium]|nr:hypothetical protein [Bacillota bacterium]